MSITTIANNLACLIAPSGSGLGHQAESTSPLIPALLVLFVCAIVFLFVRLAWTLVKSRLKKPQ